MPLMPHPEPRPEPLARARARLEFDTLLLDRVRTLQHKGTGGPWTPEEVVRDAASARVLDTLARSFADQVDRENSTRGILRYGVPVDYVDAVLLDGSAGPLVVDAPDYDERPAYWHARAGVTDDGVVIRGRDLDGYLRSGDGRYAERLGLS